MGQVRFGEPIIPPTEAREVRVGDGLGEVHRFGGGDGVVEQLVEEPDRDGPPWVSTAARREERAVSRRSSVWSGGRGGEGQALPSTAASTRPLSVWE